MKGSCPNKEEADCYENGTTISSLNLYRRMETNTKRYVIYARWLEISNYNLVMHTKVINTFVMYYLTHAEPKKRGT